ncbi:MAG: hypothetical protein AB7I41_11980 [Candidatus Sericytochromatia bacterium]
MLKSFSARFLLMGLAISSTLSILGAFDIAPALAQNAQVASAVTGPSIDQSSLIVWLNKRGLYYPKPNQSTDTQWSWLPSLDFKLNGPIESGTLVTVEYWLGTSKTPWLRYELNPSPQPATGSEFFSRVGAPGDDQKATVATGPVVLTIRASNELKGTEQWLYKGTLDVKKYNPLDPKQFPAFKNKFDYYVDQDWRMPFGYLTGNWYESNYTATGLNNTPTLSAVMWFRGDSTSLQKTQAHLFYQGKNIARAEGNSTTWSTTETSPYSWSAVKFTFMGRDNAGPVFFYDLSQSNAYASAHVLAKNPGDYEIKVLHDGKLSRSLKFAVGNDGKVVDNGFSLRTSAFDRWTFPVKVLAQTDGHWNAKGWEKGAFYGNPLLGFKAP